MLQKKIIALLLGICVYCFGQSPNNNIKEGLKNNTSINKKINPKLPPSQNFDLSQWRLALPIDKDKNGKADNIYEAELNAGYVNKDYFFTGKGGGMVFKCPVKAAPTIKNEKYASVLLREMLRKGDKTIKSKGVNKNNWVFGSAPPEDLKAAAAIDGKVTATLAINHVTTTGDKSQIGRVIIGEIHSNTDEPIRIYYRKLKNNPLGAIYFAHEINHAEDIYYEMIGEKSSGVKNPIDGIALNEKFTYEIEVMCNDMWVTISRKGKKDVYKHIDMSESGYNIGGQYQYFKVGLYHANNSGHNDDYAQATFYNLEVTH